MKAWNEDRVAKNSQALPHWKILENQTGRMVHKYRYCGSIQMNSCQGHRRREGLVCSKQKKGIWGLSRVWRIQDCPPALLGQVQAGIRSHVKVKDVMNELAWEGLAMNTMDVGQPEGQLSCCCSIIEMDTTRPVNLLRGP